MTNLRRNEGLRTRSGAAAKLVELSAVAFAGAGLRSWGEVHEGLAFFLYFFSRFAAGFGFLVERLRDGGRAAEVAEGEDVDFKFAAFRADLQAVADVDVAAGFDGLMVARDAAEFTGTGGLGAGLVEARGP